jgi:hypothetical protein
MSSPGEGFPETKLREWLNTQGYPLELRVARAFRQAGAAVDVGRYFRDPESQTPREIDVIATFQSHSHRMGVPWRFSFVVECKASRTPWVAMVNSLESAWSPILLSERVYHSRWSSAVREASQQELVAEFLWEKAERRIAHSAVRTLADNNSDVSFGALMTASKAAYWHALDAHERDPSTHHLVFPAVVVGADLWVCSLPDGADDVVIERTSSIVPMRLLHPIGGRHSTIADLVSGTTIDAYVRQCAELAGGLAGWL